LHIGVAQQASQGLNSLADEVEKSMSVQWVGC